MAKKPNQPYTNIEKALLPEEPEIEVEETIVEMEGEPEEVEEAVEVILDEDGGATVLLGDEEDEYVSKHEENLAERMDETDLASIAEEILMLYDMDRASRESWEKTYSEGFKLLGFQYEEKTQPFRGASGAHVPLVNEAILQFTSQAMRELMPSGGPVRTQVIGKSNRNREMQAQRVQEFMNYQITTVMKEYTPDFDQMLWYVGYGGSAFKKVYFDRNKKR